jgi:cytochrome b561
MRSANSSFYDRPQSFGWISIAVHWITAIVIIVLWFVGDSITAQEPDLIDQRRSLHITIALSFYLLLLFRIYWRLKVGHPHVAGQTVLIHRVAQFVHYVLLAAVATMLATGPAMLLAGYIESPALRDLSFTIHKLTGTIVISLTLLHIAGSLKHLMFHHDETIIRMIKPQRPDNDD